MLTSLQTIDAAVVLTLLGAAGLFVVLRVVGVPLQWPSRRGARTHRLEAAEGASLDVEKPARTCDRCP